MKKIVHYHLNPKPLKFGKVAILKPIDHPDVNNVSNTKEVFTSNVVSWDEETGIIETLNTIYKPASNYD